MKILTFDTETTGLPEKDASIYNINKWPHIIQLSYILYDSYDNNVIIKNHYIKINKQIDISNESYEKHKIVYDFLDKNGIPIIDALKEFNDHLDNCDIVVGHNLSFDKRMIFVECLRNKVNQNFTKFKGNKKFVKNEFCTMKNTKEFCNIINTTKNNLNYLKSPSLSELYIKLFPNDELPNELHNSLVDILCTFRCYLKFDYNVDIMEINEEIYNIFLQFKQ